MFNLSFVQAGFLLAGLTAAIPIIIHLLLKQRARRVDIGSVRFLQKVLKEQNRMRRLREWLLLAARIITALLLAFLFARPFFDQTSAEAGRREVVYLLDRSASMQLNKDGESVFEKAYDALQDEMFQIPDETILRMAAFDAEGVVEIDWENDHDPPEPSYAGTDYAKALSWALNTLQQSTREEKEIVMFTDLQQSGLGQTQLTNFPPHIEVKIRDFGQSISGNRSIRRAAATAVEIRPKMPPTVEVDIHNGSPIPAENINVTLALKTPNGKTFKQSQQVSILGSDITTAEFKINKAIEGIYAGKVVIDSKDELAADNQRFIAFEARRPDRILLVDGEEGSSVYGDETYYLQTALRVGEGQSDRDVPSYEVERIVWDNGRGFPDLRGFRAIVLTNVGSFTSADADRLRNYLGAGGRLVVFCGDKFSRRAARPLFEEGVLPCSVEGTGTIGPYRISEWDKTHPIFRPFDDPQYGDLRSLRFQKLALFSHEEQNDRMTTLASTTTGNPILIESLLGKEERPGKVLVWASTADSAWTNLPQGRLFVPIVRQLLAYATDHHERTNQTEEIVATQKPGIKQLGERFVVANMDPLESELARVSPEEFRESLNLPETKKFSDLTPEQLASLAPPKGALRPEEIWKTVAWLLLGWLLLETFLAGRVHA